VGHLLLVRQAGDLLWRQKGQRGHHTQPVHAAGLAVLKPALVLALVAAQKPRLPGIAQGTPRRDGRAGGCAVVPLDSGQAFGDEPVKGAGPPNAPAIDEAVAAADLVAFDVALTVPWFGLFPRSLL
jgi:hypothetical protein